MKKIGVYICHCGSNISDVVDVEKTSAALADIEGVHCLEDNHVRLFRFSPERNS